MVYLLIIPNKMANLNSFQNNGDNNILYCLDQM